MFTVEVYPNAPLQLMALEIRYPTALRATREETIETFQARLSAFPILEVDAAGSLEIGPGGVKTDRLYRFLRRDRRESVTVRPTSLTLESADYPGYKEFRRNIESVLEAFSTTVGFAGVVRLGIRYWDEVRIPATIETPGDWTPFINTALLSAPSLSAGLSEAGFDIDPVATLGMLTYRVSEEQMVVVRFGANPEGRVVQETGPLKIQEIDDTVPYFLIDIDSYWNAPDGFRDFEMGAVLDKCDDLHVPTRVLFEAAITDRLRDEVFRKEQV